MWEIKLGDCREQIISVESPRGGYTDCHYIHGEHALAGFFLGNMMYVPGQSPHLLFRCGRSVIVQIKQAVEAPIREVTWTATTINRDGLLLLESVRPFHTLNWYIEIRRMSTDRNRCD